MNPIVALPGLEGVAENYCPHGGLKNLGRAKNEFLLK
jgi:hypothetical protein